MVQIQCLKCKTMIKLKEIKIGTHAVCECGCIQICLDCNELISRWRVVNPFSVEDRRNK